MAATVHSVSSRPTQPQWLKDLRPFGRSDTRKAVGQIANTLLPYGALWAVMIATIRLDLPYIVTLAVAVVAAGFLVRTFIFFHDCCHGSFFPSRQANRIFGYVTGILTFTPFDQWRYSHATHHATAANLDRRGTGDVWTMTVKEFKAAPRWKRLAYRVFRNPLVMFGLGPLLSFVISQRFTPKGANKRGRYSVVLTNVALLLILVLAWATIGLRTYLLIQLPVILIAAMMGIWLFYIQHQYPDVFWTYEETWDPVRAAMEGSSYYKLPKILQWFSGNIGLHHIHHLRPAIPNYNLQACYDAIPGVQAIQPLTLDDSLRCIGLALYDEDQGRLIRFRDAKQR
jgi:acyl-lipid omega-6 desaturase (Delta-12 desaturase)